VNFSRHFSRAGRQVGPSIEMWDRAHDSSPSPFLCLEVPLAAMGDGPTVAVAVAITLSLPGNGGCRQPAWLWPKPGADGGLAGGGPSNVPHRPLWPWQGPRRAGECVALGGGVRPQPSHLSARGLPGA